MKDESVLVEHFGQTPVILVIDFLLENRLFDYSKQQIAEESGIGRVTLFNNWNKIEKLGLVKETRRFGKTKLYKLDEANPVVKKLIELEILLGEKAAEPQTIKAKARV
ncbi:MAG: hypothetical protein V1722_04615 [Candidatus Micrarchaeota archaeon]